MAVTKNSDAEDVYENDPDRATNADSCNPNTSSNSSSGGGGGGWLGGFFLGAGSCYGNCDVPDGIISVYESPPEDDE